MLDPEKEISDKQRQDVAAILRDLLKVIKVVSLYPEDNPLPQSLRRTFAEHLVDLIEDYGDIAINVDKDKLEYEDETAFVDKSKEESLAGMLFEVGITRFSFKSGLEISAVYQLLDVIKKYQNSYDHAKDLAAKLWEANIPRFSFKTIEDIALAQYDGDFNVNDILKPVDDDTGNLKLRHGEVREYNDIFDEDSSVTSGGSYGDFVGGEEVVGGEVRATQIFGSSDQVEAAELGDVRNSGTVLDTGEASLDEDLKISEAVQAMGFGDIPAKADAKVPDTTLILNDEFNLTSEQEEIVQKLLVHDADFMLWESTAELLKELLHQESEMPAFKETVTICEKVLTELVEAGKLIHAADVLRYTISLEEQIRNERPLWADRLRDCRVTLGGRDRLSVLRDALNTNKDIGAMELRRYLDNFGWESLLPITDLLSTLTQEHHRESVNDYLSMRGQGNMKIIAAGLSDNRTEVVASSVTVLARIGDDEALKLLHKVVSHKDAQVRLAMARTLKDCPNDAALALLRTLAVDQVPEIRTTAVGSIVARRGQPAFDAITEIINDEGFAQLDREDQAAILRAYSILGGDLAVEYLGKLINSFNPFGRKDVNFYREAAFEALIQNKGQKSEKLLVKLAGSWRGEIKNQAKEALQRRRELIYGESNG